MKDIYAPPEEQELTPDAFWLPTDADSVGLVEPETQVDEPEEPENKIFDIRAEGGGYGFIGGLVGAVELTPRGEIVDAEMYVETPHDLDAEGDSDA